MAVRLVAEPLAFPSGKHDDQVDALSVLFQALQNIARGPSPVLEEEPKMIVGGGKSTVCMEDLWNKEARRSRRTAGRIV